MNKINSTNTTNQAKRGWHFLDLVIAEIICQPLKNTQKYFYHHQYHIGKPIVTTTYHQSKSRLIPD
jgi:hypothetical protein